MVGRSDEDKSCTGPANQPKPSESRKTSSKEKIEKIEETQRGETTQGPGVTQGAEATQQLTESRVDAQVIGDGDRSCTGPVVQASRGRANDVRKLDEMIGGGGGQSPRGKNMDNLDVTALNNMEHARPENEDSFERTWVFFRRKRRGTKRKKGQRRRSKLKKRKASKKTSKEVTDKANPNKNPFMSPFPKEEDISTVHTVATTKGDGPGLTEVVNKIQRQHDENEQKYRKHIIEQENEMRRMREELAKKDDELELEEMRKERACWAWATRTYLAKTMTSVFCMVMIYTGFFMAIHMSFGALTFAHRWGKKADWK